MLKLSRVALLALSAVLMFSGGAGCYAKGPAGAPAKSKCDLVKKKLEEKREGLHFALGDLMQCARAGDVNYDCTQNYDAVELRYKEFQSVLNHEVKPCVDPAFAKGAGQTRH